MPRKTRMYLPDIPAHIVQRGNNREACFFCDEDYLYYKELLSEGMRRYGAVLHAYCLMTNHVHLLMTPRSEDSLSRVIQHVGRQYVQYINGTLWEGRHKSSLVDAENYLLICYRYIELNPVVAGMVNTPDEYRWSSYRCNAWGKEDSLVTAHTEYLSVASNPDERRGHYRELFRVSIPDTDLHQIREAIAKNYPTGNDSFREQIENAIGRKLGSGQRGRPKKLIKK